MRGRATRPPPADKQDDQRPRDATCEPLEQPQYSQQDQAEHDRAPLGVAEVRDDLPKSAERAVGVDCDPEELRQLGDDDDDRDSIDEPGQSAVRRSRPGS